MRANIQHIVLVNQTVFYTGSVKRDLFYSPASAVIIRLAAKSLNPTRSSWYYSLNVHLDVHFRKLFCSTTFYGTGLHLRPLQVIF